jgi:predicted O-methyltransferase YrrM
MASFEQIEEYAEHHTRAVSDLHGRLWKETHQKTNNPGMMVGPLEGALLKLLVRLTAAKRVLEIGMFTGYSALAMAEALPENGQLITCDVNPATTEIARRYFAESAHGHKIEIKLGPARETLKALKGPFDLCFIDADKESYNDYYEGAIYLVRRADGCSPERSHSKRRESRKRSASHSRRRHVGLSALISDRCVGSAEQDRRTKRQNALPVDPSTGKEGAWGLRVSCLDPYWVNNFFRRSMISGGWVMTSLTMTSSSSPLIGSSSNFFFLMSSRKAGSLSIFSYASRRTFTRSGGVPGEVNIGRPKVPLARITVARRRPLSGVLWRSMSSYRVGISAKRGSRWRPV